MKSFDMNETMQPPPFLPLTFLLENLKKLEQIIARNGEAITLCNGRKLCRICFLLQECKTQKDARKK